MTTAGGKKGRLERKGGLGLPCYFCCPAIHGGPEKGCAAGGVKNTTKTRFLNIPESPLGNPFQAFIFAVR